MRHSHAATRDLMRRYFISGLSAAKQKRMASGIDGCADCRAHFQRMSAFESLLYGDGEKMSPFALERQEAVIMARSQTVVQLWRMPVIGAVAALAGMMLMMFALWSGGMPNRFPGPVPLSDNITWSELRPKSAGVSENNRVGIRVFKVYQKTDAVALTGTLSREDTITFSYSLMDNRYRYFTLMGIQDANTFFFYYPNSATQSISVAGNVVDEPLGDGFRLNSHRNGPLRIVGLFSDAPLSIATIEQQLAQKVTALMQPSPLQLQLQGVSVVEHSIWVDIKK